MMDACNAIFVLLACAAAINDLLQLRVDREVKGYTLSTAALFTAWPLWDCYYLGRLQQYWSCAAYILLILIRLAWLVLALHVDTEEENE